VVTPFHNTEPYLAECIESVLKQTYQNFEYVLVNNASTDRSAAIADAYAAQDPRVKLVHTPRFFTQVQNYNYAIQQLSPQGCYTKIVQADDWLFRRCLSEMVELGEAHPSVAIVGSYWLKGTALRGDGLLPTQAVVSGREVCRRHLLQGVYLLGSPSTLLFRSDIVRSRTPFYTENRLNEDTEACYEILQDRDFGFVHQVLSFMRTQDDSITGAARGLDPTAVDLLILLRRYGAMYLGPEELAQQRAQAERAYWRLLGQAWLSRRGKEFFDYHRAGLATIGERIERPALVLNALPAVLRYVLSPYEVAAAIGRRVRRWPLAAAPTRS